MGGLGSAGRSAPKTPRFTALLPTFRSFLELSRLVDPGSEPKTDKSTILGDAIRYVQQVTVENHQLKQLNKFLEVGSSAINPPMQLRQTETGNRDSAAFSSNSNRVSDLPPGSGTWAGLRDARNAPAALPPPASSPTPSPNPAPNPTQTHSNQTNPPPMLHHAPQERVCTLERERGQQLYQHSLMLTGMGGMGGMHGANGGMMQAGQMMMAPPGAMMAGPMGGEAGGGGWRRRVAAAGSGWRAAEAGHGAAGQGEAGQGEAGSLCRDRWRGGVKETREGGR